MTGDRASTAVEIMAAVQRARGSVTEFLEHLADEPIDAQVLSQGTGPAGNDNMLGLVRADELIRRSVLLTGRTSGRPFVYAESWLAAARLPDSVRLRLEASRDPIGRVLAECGLSIGREPLAGPVVPSDATARFAGLLGGAALSRRYRMTLDSRPAIVVNEWFLQTVSDALVSPGAPSPDPSASSIP